MDTELALQRNVINSIDASYDIVLDLISGREQRVLLLIMLV